jgi:hypothetical protein
MASASQEVKELCALIAGPAGLRVNASVAKNTIKLLHIIGRNRLRPRLRRVLMFDADATRCRENQHRSGCE